MAESKAISREVRVLLVEPSRVHRTLMAESLAAESGLRVLLPERPGTTAHEAVTELRPDVLLLSTDPVRPDPGADLRHIMATVPTPTIMVGEGLVDHVELSRTLEAMGALHVVNRPSANDKAYLPDWAASLAPLVRRGSRIKVVRILGQGATPPTSLPAARPAAERNGGAPLSPVMRPDPQFLPRVIVIGASTGGPDALRRLLAGLPGDFSVPIVIAQHMPSGFTRDLMQSIGTDSLLPVLEVTDGMRLQPRVAHVAPAGKNTAFRTGGALTLIPPSARLEHTPSATMLFQSASAAFGEHVVGIVLTGIGDDGAAGIRTIKAGGGMTIAQDRGSCSVFGMPAAALATSCVDHSGTPEAIARLLASLHHRRHTVSP